MSDKPRRETLQQLLRRYESEETYSFSEVDKIEVNTKGLEDWTPLHMAVLRCSDDPGAIDDVITLLEAGADATAASDIGLTPLHGAASLGNLEVCKLLIAHGAIAESASKFGETPIGAATAGGHGDVVEFLESQTRETRC